MYDDIAELYLEIFPLNQAFLAFIPEYLGNPGSAFLDLGCGPGDYVDALTRAGYQGVGIDSSKGMIAKAQAQKQGTFRNLSFDQIGQLDAVPEGGFECAFCVGNSLSYLPKEATQPFLKEVSHTLRPSGFFVLQVVNWDKLGRERACDFPVKAISEGRSFHRCYAWMSPSQVIFHTEIRKGDELMGAWAASLYPKTLQDLLGDLESAGLTPTGQFGDYDKSPFDPGSSPATILVAQK